MKKERWVTWSTVILGFSLVIPQMAIAQDSTEPAVRIEASGSIDHVSIYDGDATVGGYSAWGFTGALSLRTGSPVGGELFFSYTPKSSDPYSRTPQIKLPGGWVTFSFSKDPRKGFDVFLAAGAAYLDVSGWPDFSGCVPPECFAEGGPAVSNGGDWSLMWGGGVAYRFPGRVSLRVDARIPTKTDAIQERTTRIGIGGGFRIW